MGKINRGKRGRPEKIEPLRKAITKIWDNHPTWKDSEIRDELKVYLQKVVKKERPKWDVALINEEVDRRLPSTYSIGDFRRDILEPNGKEISKLDNRWHLGTLKDCPLTPEGIAKVFEIKCLFGRPPKRQKGAWGISLSIREAIWISRLSLIGFKNAGRQFQQLLDYVKDDDDIEPQKRLIPLRLWDFAADDDPTERERRRITVLIWDLAHDYADAERISELSGVPFDSYDMDEQIYELLGYPKPNRMGGTK